MSKVRVQALAIVLVAMDHDVVERLSDEQTCVESPEDLFTRLETMMEEGESPENLNDYLKDMYS